MLLQCFPIFLFHHKYFKCHDICANKDIIIINIHEYLRWDTYARKSILVFVFVFLFFSFFLDRCIFWYARCSSLQHWCHHFPVNANNKVLCMYSSSFKLRSATIEPILSKHICFTCNLFITRHFLGMLFWRYFFSFFFFFFYNREFVNQGYKTEKFFIVLNKLAQDQSLHPPCNTMTYILFLSFEMILI